MSSVIEMYEKQMDLNAKARKLEKVSGMSIDQLIEHHTGMRRMMELLADSFERVNIMTPEEMRALLKLDEEGSED